MTMKGTTEMQATHIERICKLAKELTLEFTGGVAVRVKRLVSRGFNYDLVGGFYGNTDARKTM